MKMLTSSAGLYTLKINLSYSLKLRFSTRLSLRNTRRLVFGFNFERMKFMKGSVKSITKKQLVRNLMLGGLSCFLLFILLYCEVVFYIVKYCTSFKFGFFISWIMRTKFETLHASVYIFNITNADSFMAGTDYKLKVEKVGPFTYHEFRHHEDVDIDLEKERISYTPQYKFYFVPEKSIGHPKDFNIVVPNIAMMGLAANLASFPYFTQIAYNIITTRHNSKALLSIDAHSYLWGYDDTLLTLAHNIVPGYITYEKMGVLYYFLDNNKTVRVDAATNDEEKFMVKSWNGYSKLKMAESNPESCEKCNTFENTYDGIGYPSGRTKDFRIRLVRKGICRVADMEYNGTRTMYYGGDAMVYRFSQQFLSIDPNKTYDGMFDLSKCYYGVPVTLTRPNFLDVDPKVYERIEGIIPSKEVERGYIVIEPLVALQVDTRMSLQLNFALRDVSFNSKLRPFSNMILPIFYIDAVQAPLPRYVDFCLILIYKVIPYMTPVTQIVLFLLTIYYWLSFGIAIKHRCRTYKASGLTFLNLDTKVEVPHL